MPTRYPPSPPQPETETETETCGDTFKDDTHLQCYKVLAKRVRVRKVTEA